MILIGHAIVGGSLAATQSNPAAAFFIGLLSHYAADMLPHYDHVVPEVFRDPWSRKAFPAYVRITVDGMLGIIVPLLIFYPATTTGLFVMLAGIIGGMLPDVLWGLGLMFKKNRLLGLHYRFHYRMHTMLTTKDYQKTGLVLTVLLCAAAIWFGLRFRAMM